MEGSMHGRRASLALNCKSNMPAVVIPCTTLVRPAHVSLGPHQDAAGSRSPGLCAFRSTRQSQLIQRRPVLMSMQTLAAFADNTTQGKDSELSKVLLAVAAASISIAESAGRVSIDKIGGYAEATAVADATRDQPKKLDVLANDIMKDMLAASGAVAVLASEEDDEPVVVESVGAYAVVFDPLDGSRNIEVCIPTGTIFGIYRQAPPAPGQSQHERALASCLQPGNQLEAAGYALYSSATMLVLTTGAGTHGFTLDRQIGEFVLTHKDIRIPTHGQIYSVNDARYFDWPAGLQRYIDTIRKGEGRNPKQYSARYVCSLVADFHRGLLYGGLTMNPRSHLRLVYEANPLAFVAEQAGGKGCDGKRRILDIVPDKVHQRLPLFLGSPDDIDELMSYGDVQQTSAKTYTV